MRRLALLAALALPAVGAAWLAWRIRTDITCTLDGRRQW